MTSEQILQKYEIQLNDISGVYFMANNSGFSGCPIFTFQMKCNKRKKVKLSKSSVTPMLHYLAEENIPFLNFHPIPNEKAHIDDKSYRSISNEVFFLCMICNRSHLLYRTQISNEVFFLCMAMFSFIMGIEILYSKGYFNTDPFLTPVFKYLFGAGCIFISYLFLVHPSVKIEGDSLMLKGYFKNKYINLCDITKVTVSSLGKGDVIEVTTSNFDYYFFPIVGGRLKKLINDLNQIGIDASYGYWEIK